MNLLLLDDEPMMLEMLDDAVAEVFPSANRAQFNNAKDGLAYAKENQIDIAFLDINLMGTSGLEVARQLVALYPKVNIIFCTGYGEYAVEAFKMYASGFLPKPIWAENIKEAVEHLRFPVEQPKRLCSLRMIQNAGIIIIFAMICSNGLKNWDFPIAC